MLSLRAVVSLTMILTAWTYCVATPAGAQLLTQNRREIVHAPGLPGSDYHLARNTPVLIELLEPIDSAITRAGEPFRYRVVHDVLGDRFVVIAAGTAGRGIVRKVRRGDRSVEALLGLGFGEVSSVEGRGVKLAFTEPARRLSPRVGNCTALLGGYFENSTRRVRLDAGTRLYVVVEFPYGTRRIEAGDQGGSYYLFRSREVPESRRRRP